MEWLWHPQVLNLYNRVLQQCDINATSREAAAGALQNITAGDKRVSRRSGLSFRPPTHRGRTFYFLIPHLSLVLAVGIGAEPGGIGAGAHPAGAAGPAAHHQRPGVALTHRFTPEPVQTRQGQE